MRRPCSGPPGAARACSSWRKASRSATVVATPERMCVGSLQAASAACWAARFTLKGERTLSSSCTKAALSAMP